MKQNFVLLTAILTVSLGLAACGGTTAPATSAVAASPSSAAASAKPAADASSAASPKPGTSGASASAKPAASGAAASGPPAAARTPVVEVAKVPPGPPTPATAAVAAKPVAERPPLAASYSQPIGPYSLYLETIASAAPSTAGLLSIPGCVVESIFKRGQRVVFRYSIIDMATGKRVTDRDGSTSKVNIAANQSVDGYFAPRGAPPPPPDAPWTWVGVWNIPADFPLGNVSPAIDLTTGGKTATIKAADFAALPVQIVD